MAEYQYQLNSGCLWALHRCPPISSLRSRVSYAVGPDDCPLPVVIYLDDIAMYRDTQQEVLEDTLEAVKQLTATGFMLNLHKSQLVQAAA